MMPRFSLLIWQFNCQLTAISVLIVSFGQEKCNGNLLRPSINFLIIFLSLPSFLFIFFSLIFIFFIIIILNSKIEREEKT